MPQIPASQEVPSTSPFTLPDDSHGWRGLQLPASAGSHRRKWYTLLHNEYCLVTAFVSLPGEQSIRHSHETGELNISYWGENQPRIHWNPPGVLHGPGLLHGKPIEASTGPALDERVRSTLSRIGGRDPDLKDLLEMILQREVNVSEQLAALAGRPPGLHVAIDVLFPPFKTTIDDPLYPEKRTVVGQWFD